MSQLPSPFRTPELVTPRVKTLVYGPPGVGKTYLALGAPGPVAVIDTEAGTAFYAGREGLSPFSVLSTKTYADVKAALGYLAIPGHGFETLVIDPVTVIYETLQESAQLRRGEANRRRGRGEVGEDADLEMLDWGRIKRSYKALMTAIVNLPLHVVVTAREKDIMEGTGDARRKVGVGPDAEKGTQYHFDVVLRLEAAKAGARVAVVTKDRTGAWGLNAVVPDPTFDTLFRSVLARVGTADRHVPDDAEAAKADAEAAVAAAGPTARQIADLVAALEAAGQDPETVKASLGVADFRELTPGKVTAVTNRALKAAAKAPTPPTDAPSAPAPVAVPSDPTPPDSAAPAVEAA